MKISLLISWYEIEATYFSIIGFKKGRTFSIASMLARDWTSAIGIIKKKVRKNKATAMSNLRMLRSKYGMARFSQKTSRGSGAHSVSQIVGLLVCWVWAHTAAAHRVLNETKAAGITAFGLFMILSLSSASCLKWTLRN